MTIDATIPKKVLYGSEAIPAGHGNFGQNAFFAAQPMLPGHAVVRSLSNDDNLIPPSSL